MKFKPGVWYLNNTAKEKHRSLNVPKEYCVFFAHKELPNGKRPQYFCIMPRMKGQVSW